MITFETQVFDYVYAQVEDLLPAGCFRNGYTPTAPKFPFATLCEIGNEEYLSARDSSTEEYYALVTYEANVYANDRFTVAKVMGAIDAAMRRFNFTRVSSDRPVNLADPEIQRMTNRYRAGVTRDGVFFRV